MNTRIETTAVRAGGTLAAPGAIVSRVGVSIRDATLADVPFIDRLQKAHSRELGFLPTMAIEGKIKLGQVLIAESGQSAVGGGQAKTDGMPPSALPTAHCPPPTPVGYLIAADRYFKRDEIGYVTQINVLPEVRRSLVAAQLLQAQFDRSAYGCRLYCCWCAQDLKANAFWEAMGFTPIAFRTGSRTKGRDAGGKRAARIHLFWQKRIRAGDTGDVTRGGTPWWYPAQTAGGELREDRLVFPIPPGVNWRDVLPVVLPEMANAAVANANPTDAPALPSPKRPQPKPKAPAATMPAGGLWFGGSAGPTDAERAAKAEARATAKAAARSTKIDPRVVAMARELRDRWSEQAETLPALAGKYDVRRTTDTPRAVMAIDASPIHRPALPVAA